MTHYEIHAYAENTVFHRSFSAVLNADGKFVDACINDALYFEELPKLSNYVDQDEANKFSAHTNVKFSVVEISTDPETDDSTFTEKEVLNFEIVTAA